MAKPLKVRNSANTEWVPIASVVPAVPDISTFATIEYVDSEISNIDLTPYLTQSTASSTYLTQATASSDYATKEYADNSASVAAAAIVDSSPAALNTLNELAAALGDDENFATSVTNSLSNKLDISSASVTYATKDELNSFSSETFLIKEENYSAQIGDVIFVNSASGAYTITLPTSLTLGDKIMIADLANNCANNNITIARNGEKIDGESSNFIIDVNNAAVEFIYTNSAYGWRTLNG